MNFTAKTEKQLVEERLIPDGVYPFEVISAEDKKSKKGNDMIEMEVRLFMPDGTSRSMTDWIMEKMAFKLFHFCAYTGLSQKYDAGTLQSQDCVGRTGFAKVGIQADKSGQYPDRNTIADYVRTPEMKKNGVVASKPEQTGTSPLVRNEALDEDVPF
jgi:hypothetical protein